RQNRPESYGCGAERDPRGRLPRVLVWVPTKTQSARCAGCAHCRDQQPEGELHTRRRYPVVLHGGFPVLGHPLPEASGRRHAHPPARSEMVAGRRSRRRDRDDRGKGDGPGFGDLTAARERLFSYDPERDAYACPGGHELRPLRHGKLREMTKVDYGNPAACRDCPLRPRCTDASYRAVSRLEHEDALDRMAARLKARPEILDRRRETVEHP